MTAPAADFIVVLVTVPDADTGARLARALVEDRLAACVNLVPGLRSVYSWEGKINDDSEVLCLVKTRRDLYEAVRERVTALHPYQVPEVIALGLEAGNAPYLSWLAEATRRG